MEFKDRISELTTCEVINILKNQKLNLDDEDLNILRRIKISGSSLLLIKKKDLLEVQLQLGPTLSIIGFIRKLEESMCLCDRLVSFVNINGLFVTQL